jgi:hypothetical protein
MAEGEDIAVVREIVDSVCDEIAHSASMATAAAE